MDPNGESPEPNNPLPGHQPVTSSSGSDWQKEAIAAARAGNQPAANLQANSRTPDWQQGFQHHRAAPEAEVPDMLAAADPVPPANVSHPARSQPQPHLTPSANPLPGAASGQPVVSGAFGEDVPAAVPVMGSGGPKLGKKLLIAGAGLVGVLVLGAAAYFVFAGSGSKSVKDANDQSNKSASSAAIDLSTLSDVTFVPPSLDGYTKDETSSSDTFITYVNGSKTCALGFGTVPENSFPGATAEEMVNNQVQELRRLGAAVDGPDAGEALIIKSASDSKTTYKMPTLSYTFTKGQATGKVLYSLVILKDKRLAIVNRQCANANGPVSDADLAAQDKKARELTVGSGTAH